MKILMMVLGLGLYSFVFATVADGDRAVDAGDYRTAIAEYEEAFALRSSNIEALYKLARAKTYLAETLEGDDAKTLYEEAVAHARQAVELDDSEPETHFELARALGRLAQFKGVLQSLGIAEEVKDALERTLELAPEHAAAMHALALWHLEVPWVAGGRSGQVSPLFEQAITLEPEVISHRSDYAEALLRLDRPEEAREQLDIALRLEPEDAQSENALAKAQRLLDEHF